MEEPQKKSQERLDFNKVFFHGPRLKQFLKEGDCPPVHMTVGFTGWCNNNCLWCNAYHFRKKGEKIEIDPDVMVKFLDEASKEGLKAISIVGSGEPLLHSNATDLIYRIAKTGLKQGMYTNGTELTEEKSEAILGTFTFLRVSLDSATSETHHRLHRGPLDQDGFSIAVRGLEYLVRNRKGKFPTLGIQFVTSQHNIEEIFMAAQLAKDIGVEYIAYKPMMKNPLNPEHDKNVLVLDDDLRDKFRKLREYSGGRFKVYVKESQFEETLGRDWNNGQNYPVCLGHFFSPSLNADGKLYLCVGMEGRETFTLGNIYTSSFRELWYGPKRKESIASINLGNCPSACRQDPLSKILYGLTLEEAEKRIAEAGFPDPEMHPDFL
jgi:GTP 3',8-cyclase